MVFRGMLGVETMAEISTDFLDSRKKQCPSHKARTQCQLCHPRSLEGARPQVSSSYMIPTGKKTTCAPRNSSEIAFAGLKRPA